MPKLKSQPKKSSKKQPLWKGPEVDGITQSLLSRFLVCRERFRLYVVEGLCEADRFNHRLEYGNMWHVCEESLAGTTGPGTVLPHRLEWETPLTAYCQVLCKRYPTQQPEIQHWYNVCKVQFPIYVNYWKKHQDVKDRTPLMQEQVFDVPYELPSGRVVRLRGKWDSVDLVGKGKGVGIYLQENKTKGDINEQQLKRQLQFDLQTMLYLIALDYHVAANGPINEQSDGIPILGVRYNVVRRPLSGGKGSIRKHQPTKSNPLGESDEEFYARLGGIINEDPSYFFMRWKVEINRSDIDRFKREFLNPCLEELCRWWDDQKMNLGKPFDGTEGHFRLPYGIRNPIAEGGSTELDEYLATGSMLGLGKADNLFKELDV